MHKPIQSTQTILRSLIIFILLASPIAIAGCAASKSALTSDVTTMEREMVAPEAPVAMSDMAGNAFSPSTVQAESVERIVLKNASLSIVVDDPAATMDAITKLAEEMKGFVVSANLNKYTLENNVEVPHATITIRIPEEKLNDAIAEIEKQSKQEPLNKTLNSQDVTSEYTDLQSRLRNLESAEEQLRKIMEDAVRTEDVLSVYNQLVSIREQIEVVKGQIKYYDEASALSSISVDILANEAVQPLTIGGWQPVGVAKSAVQALINTLKVIVNVVIWLIIFILPILIVFVVIFILPLTWLFRMWKRNRARRKARLSSSSIQSESPTVGTPPDQG
jgi:hypothetical protein